jgi:hypothetical protein
LCPARWSGRLVNRHRFGEDPHQSQIFKPCRISSRALAAWSAQIPHDLRVASRSTSCWRWSWDSGTSRIRGLQHRLSHAGMIGSDLHGSTDFPHLPAVCTGVKDMTLRVAGRPDAALACLAASKPAGEPIRHLTPPAEDGIDRTSGGAGSRYGGGSRLGAAGRSQRR